MVGYQGLFGMDSPPTPVANTIAKSLFADSGAGSQFQA